MSYFTLNAQTSPNDLRVRYRELCKLYHPDKGGTDAIQAQINIEYQEALKQLADFEQQKGNLPLHDKILWQLENHLNYILNHVKENKELYNSIYIEAKTKIPNKYHGLLDELINLIKLQ